MNAYGAEKGTILAIEDDAAIVATLTKTFTAAGYSAYSYRDVQTALERYREISPDLLISDIQFAGPDGRRLIAAIRRTIGYVEVPLMFLSAMQVPDIIHRTSAEARGTYFLRKPFDPQVLLELVDKALWSPRLTATR